MDRSAIENIQTKTLPGPPKYSQTVRILGTLSIENVFALPLRLLLDYLHVDVLLAGRAVGGVVRVVGVDLDLAVVVLVVIVRQLVQLGEALGLAVADLPALWPHVILDLPQQRAASDAAEQRAGWSADSDVCVVVEDAALCVDAHPLLLLLAYVLAFSVRWPASK